MKYFNIVIPTLDIPLVRNFSIDLKTSIHLNRNAYCTLFFCEFIMLTCSERIGSFSLRCASQINGSNIGLMDSSLITNINNLVNKLHKFNFIIFKHTSDLKEREDTV